METTRESKIEKQNGKHENYCIGDIVYYWRGSMPGTYKIMSNPRRDWLGRKYYLTRFNKKDYLHGLPNYRTIRLYHNKIEYKIQSENTSFEI